MSAVPGNFQFAGTYACEGSFRNGKIHRSIYTGAVALGGKWLQLTEQDVEPATGYVAEYLIGYDPQQKRLVEFDANNFAAAIYASDAGWSNSVLAMTSPVTPDPKAAYAANRFVYSLSGPDAFTVDWQVSSTAALDWVQADHLTCRRKAGAPA
ncbi:MAG TPA: hypothetical protein VHX37_03035 [Acidobacteriaceae bacterium]|jgi:hypothetical protein|nr:hypothetical protein [Acidobacteriaceae bacterium]